MDISNTNVQFIINDEAILALRSMGLELCRLKENLKRIRILSKTSPLLILKDMEKTKKHNRLVQHHNLLNSKIESILDNDFPLAKLVIKVRTRQFCYPHKGKLVVCYLMSIVVKENFSITKFIDVSRRRVSK